MCMVGSSDLCDPCLWPYGNAVNLMVMSAVLIAVPVSLGNFICECLVHRFLRCVAWLYHSGGQLPTCRYPLSALLGGFNVYISRSPVCVLI